MTDVDSYALSIVDLCSYFVVVFDEFGEIVDFGWYYSDEDDVAVAINIFDLSSNDTEELHEY